MYESRTWEFSSPCVIASTKRKLMLIVLMMKKVRVVRMTSHVRGRVMTKNCLKRLQPSRSAAS